MRTFWIIFGIGAAVGVCGGWLRIVAPRVMESGTLIIRNRKLSFALSSYAGKKAKAKP